MVMLVLFFFFLQLLLQFFGIFDFMQRRLVEFVLPRDVTNVVLELVEARRHILDGFVGAASPCKHRAIDGN